VRRKAPGLPGGLAADPELIKQDVYYEVPRCIYLLDQSFSLPSVYAGSDAPTIKATLPLEGFQFAIAKRVPVGMSIDSPGARREGAMA
jgi:hypothetical protein